MTVDDVKATFVAAGWTEFPPCEQGAEAMFEGPPLDSAYRCDTNDRPPRVHATIYYFTLGMHTHRSVTFSVVGESGGHWCDLKVYSVAFCEVGDYLKRASAVGKALWDAYVEVMERTGGQDG